jgi:hypothetical protein
MLRAVLGTQEKVPVRPANMPEMWGYFGHKSEGMSGVSTAVFEPERGSKVHTGAMQHCAHRSMQEIDILLALGKGEVIE